MSELDKLSLEDLYGEQHELAECIGLPAYIGLVKAFGGLSIYICKADSLLKSDRDSRIRQEFNGGNYRYLALKYNLTERTVRSIVYEELEALRREPLPDQLSFED